MQSIHINFACLSVYLYVCKVVISLFFVCLNNHTQEPLTDLHQILTEELVKNRGMFLAWIKNSRVSRLTFFEKV